MPDDSNYTLEAVEFKMIEGMQLLRQNKGLVSDACISSSDEFICASNLYKCDETYGEPGLY